MIRVHIICEGQTEETFVKELLLPHFLNHDIALIPTLIGKGGQKGGTIKFQRLFTDVRNRLRNEVKAYCTSFFDFYALPSDFPGKLEADKLSTIEDKSQKICKELLKNLEEELGENTVRRFIPYVQMYEFEGLLFSSPEKFAKGIYKEDIVSKFQDIRDQFSTPEEINDSPHTAPSKRVIALVTDYDKPAHGSLAALEIGLETIRAECKLFDAWLKKLEELK